jgi:hypothetical protein
MSQLYRLHKRRVDFTSEESKGSNAGGCDEAGCSERGDRILAMEQAAARGDDAVGAMDVGGVASRSGREGRARATP